MDTLRHGVVVVVVVVVVVAGGRGGGVLGWEEHWGGIESAKTKTRKCKEQEEGKGMALAVLCAQGWNGMVDTIQCVQNIMTPWETYTFSKN